VTQYQSESLNRHVANAYKFDAFSQGGVDILAAEQTEGGGNDWFRGTADAVRKYARDPRHAGRRHVQSYLYNGYWEDVGTIRSYFDANIALTKPHSSFSFYHPRCPIFMDRPVLAPTKIHDSRIADALVATRGTAPRRGSR
jgi:ADP-glucose pyrophosphorylase